MFKHLKGRRLAKAWVDYYHANCHPMWHPAVVENEIATGYDPEPHHQYLPLPRKGRAARRRAVIG